MFELLGLSLVFAGLLSINSMASLAAASSWYGLKRISACWTAATKARVAFALRALPPAIAGYFMAVSFIPAFLAHEPRQTSEVVSWKLALLASLSAAGLWMAARRAYQGWQATRRLVSEWLRQAEPLELPGLRMPAFVIRHDFPLITVVGTLRPRLFVARQALSALAPEELLAALAHEHGHLAARDNLKRVVLRACRDAFTIIPCGRVLDRAWKSASEAAADEYAARAGAATALNLASALVRIARLVPASPPVHLPAAALLLGDEESPALVDRVRRLTLLASTGMPPAAGLGWPGRLAGILGLGVAMTAVTWVAGHATTLLAVHSTIERIVALLQ